MRPQLFAILLVAALLGCSVQAPEVLAPAVERSLVQVDDGLVIQRPKLLRALDYSIEYLRSARAEKMYAARPPSLFTIAAVLKTVLRFRELVERATHEADLARQVEEEFSFVRIGAEHDAEVLVTAYYQPVYRASRKRTAEFRYPLFRVPPGFKGWRKPHPTREELEGKTGLAYPRLRGLELAYLADRLQPFLIQVQGSALLEFPDGSTMGVGYAGSTDHEYNSLGRELSKDGKLRPSEVTLATIRSYFADHPQELDRYVPRNKRFIFFRELRGVDAIGSLGVPVTAERSIATDKSIFPPGALALIRARLPFVESGGAVVDREISRFVLDQDSGGGVKGPSHIDLFLGTGEEAAARAGRTYTSGSLYYLLLKEI